MQQAFIFVFLVTWQITFIFCHSSNCSQAWNGGGTGAWYRVDSSCQYGFRSTRLIHCLPEIFVPSNRTSFTDGFYVSLGIFNRFNGVGLDIGLTFDAEKNRWFSYGNDARGWKSGNISIDSKQNRCINVSLTILTDRIHYEIQNENNSQKLGEDFYFSSQIDPQLNLTENKTQFGFYRFDSIAQTRETLKSGSQMLAARMRNWTFEMSTGSIVSARGNFIASNVRGFPPGRCCTKNEIDTIRVHEETPWNQSDISISYQSFRSQRENSFFH